MAPDEKLLIGLGINKLCALAASPEEVEPELLTIKRVKIARKTRRGRPVMKLPSLRATVTFLMLGCCLSLLCVPNARAQADPTTLHYNCTGTTACVAGATTLVTGSGLPTFTITTQPNSGLNPGQTGTLYLVALVPNASSALSFSVNGFAPSFGAPGTFSAGTLWAFLNVTPMATSQPNFNAFASASGQAGVTATGFMVSTVNLGTFTAPFGPGQTVLVTVGAGGITGISGFPVGTILYAFLTNTASSSANPSGQTAINSTPLSEAITIVPEPGTILLFGSGLVAIGGFVRRRWASKA